jgi:hypothetical protein
MQSGPWEVQLQGSASDLEHLARNFTAGALEVAWSTGDGTFLLRAASFAACSSTDALFAEAIKIATVLSGVLRLVRGSDEPLRVGTAYRTNPQGNREIAVQIQGLHKRITGGDATVTITDTGGAVIPPPPARTLSIANLAFTDAAVEKAIRLLATDSTTWVGLDRIFEVIEGDVGGVRKLVRRKWTPLRQITRFKDSANTVAVAGEQARHGTAPGAPLERPMSIDEAAAFVNYILHAWLATKDSRPVLQDESAVTNKLQPHDYGDNVAGAGFGSP